MRYFNSFLWVLMLFFLGANGLLASTCNEDYTATPPFLVQPVSPNILFVVDKSGSMGWTSYSFGAAVYSAATTYEGYFDPVARYNLSAGVWQETTNANTCVVGGPNGASPRTVAGVCSGNELNFALMDRVDVLRWAITGGRPATCSGSGDTAVNCDPDLACTGPNWCNIVTNTGHTVQAKKSRVTGLTRTFANSSNRPRFALLFYSTSIYGDKVYAGDYPNGDNASALTNNPYTNFNSYINSVSPGGGTGTAPAMWEAYDYFKQSNDHTYNRGFDIVNAANLFRDPLNFCDSTRGNCIFTPCASNFVVLATDGAWNLGDISGWGDPRSGQCDLTDGGTNYSADPVVPARLMHTDLLRTVTSASGNSFAKRVDGVYTLGIFMAGTGLQSVRHTAMFGGFDTQDGTQVWPNWALGTPLTDYLTAGCSMDDCGWGTSSACAALPPSSLDWDSRDINGNPGPDNIPDTFIDAQSGQQMQDSLTRAINEIMARVAAGSSISVLSERTTQGAVISQALFYPRKVFNTNYPITWPGTLGAYWFYNTATIHNIREDNADPFFLHKRDDNPLDFEIGNSGNLVINYYGTTVNGEIDTANLIGTYANLDLVSRVYEAGQQLAERLDSGTTTRTVYGVVDPAISSLTGMGTMESFEVANAGDFSSYFNMPITGVTQDYPNCLDQTASPSLSTRANNLISYVRGTTDNPTGEANKDCRSRRVDVAGNLWKLGDIINSTPYVETYNDYAVLFTGANDGQLHAFKVGNIRNDALGTDQVAKLCDDKSGTCSTGAIGEELWSFIPKNSLPYLKYLADPDYQHMYYIDMAPYFIEEGGKKIIIGGMRFGGASAGTYENASGTDYWSGDTDADGIVNVDSDGFSLQVTPPTDIAACTPAKPEDCTGLSSYFALDVTDPENPIFLWEYSHPMLGYGFSGPAFIQTGGGNYIMLTSGPLSSRGWTSNQDLKLFLIPVDSDFHRVDSDSSGIVNDKDVFKIGSQPDTDFVVSPELSAYMHAFGGRLFQEGFDENGDGNADIIAFGVNNWNTINQDWEGNVVVVAPNSNPPFDMATKLINWEITNVFSSPQGPFTSKVAIHKCFASTFLYAGSGRWFFKSDEAGDLDAFNNPVSTDVERLYGLRLTQCLINLLDGDSLTTCKQAMVLPDSHFSAIGDAVCNANVNIGTATNLGWAMDLEYRGEDINFPNFFKERASVDPTISDFNVAFFTSFEPTSDSCGFGGRSRVWGFNCLSGHNMWEGCTGYVPVVPDATLMLQLSGGNIKDMQLDVNAFSGDGNQATGWLKGIPPESGGKLLNPWTPKLNGEIILWIER